MGKKSLQTFFFTSTVTFGHRWPQTFSEYGGNWYCNKCLLLCACIDDFQDAIMDIIFATNAPVGTIECATFAIVNDGVPEPTESFTVQANGGGFFVNGQFTTQVNILDSSVRGINLYVFPVAVSRIWIYVEVLIMPMQKIIFKLAVVVRLTQYQREKSECHSQNETVVTSSQNVTVVILRK